jgi:hypothetical protein
LTQSVAGEVSSWSAIQSIDFVDVT